MYTEQYPFSTPFDPGHLPRSNETYHLESFYSTSPYPFRSQIPQEYLSPASTQMPPHSDLLSYSTYDSNSLNRYSSHPTDQPINGFFGQSHEPAFESELNDEQASTSFVPSSKKRKFTEESIKPSSYESEVCRVCDDASSGYHFGVFTCEACKGFFRRYSKKATVLEPCLIRCCITKHNRNNCAACRFDKCKYVGMALDKIRFGKPPKIRRSSRSHVQLEPNEHDVQLMLKLLECYQSFDENEQQPTTTSNTQSSVIVQFCHRLANIVMSEGQRRPEIFLARLKRHRSAIQFLITGENDPSTASSSWSKEPQAWVFAHNERWRLLMILLILAFDDEQSPCDETEIDRVLRLFELECDQERQARSYSFTPEKNVKYMKAQFVLRFVDMMTHDLISPPSNDAIDPYSLVAGSSQFPG